MIQVERGLLARGIINTKDLAPFVGNERGTFRDHVLNVWHWDGAILVLFLLSAPSSMLGIWLIATRRRRAASSPPATLSGMVAGQQHAAAGSERPAADGQ